MLMNLLDGSEVCVDKKSPVGKVSEFSTFRAALFLFDLKQKAMKETTLHHKSN